MAKKIDFTGKRTEWLGIWYNPQSHVYLSEVINLARLRDYKGSIRMVMRHNRFYEKHSNRPNFQIILCDSKSLDEPHEVAVEEILEKSKTYDDGELYVPIEDAARIARVAVDRIEYGYSADDVIAEIHYYMEDHAVTLTDIIEGSY